jgi:hypothetical protein
MEHSKMKNVLEQKQEKEEKFNREVDMVVFYSIAKKYGFCNPYCECGMCEK